MQLVGSDLHMLLSKIDYPPVIIKRDDAKLLELSISIETTSENELQISSL